MIADDDQSTTNVIVDAMPAGSVQYGFKLQEGDQLSKCLTRAREYEIKYGRHVKRARE